MIRRLTVREKKIFIAALAVVIVSFLYNGLIGPLQRQKEVLDEGILIQQEQLTREIRIIEESKALDEQYDRYFKQFGQSATQEETASSILSEIEEEAGKLGLHVMDLKPRRVHNSEYDSQFSVSVTTRSKLVDIICFLYRMQQSPHLFDVEEIEFERQMREDQAMITTRLILVKAFISSGSDERRDEESGGIFQRGLKDKKEE